MTPDTSQDNVPLAVLLEHLKWNLQRFREILNNSESPYFRDAALQRFEFTLESVLKCIDKAAGGDPERAQSQDEKLAYALQAGWLPQGTDCPDILKSLELLRPETRPANADAIFAKLPAYQALFENLYQSLLKLEKAGA